MKHTLRFRLTFSYSALALLLVALISLLINYLFQIQFRDYVIKQQQQRNQELVNLVEKRYADGIWNKAVLEDIGMNALDQGIILKVKDASGATVWDATVHNNGLCVQMLARMSQNMQSHYPNFRGGYRQSEFTLKSGAEITGTAQIGYYGPYYYTDNDINFLGSINTILLAVAAVSFVTSILLGAFMSKRISRPVSMAVQAATEISKGQFSRRISDRPGTLEMATLTRTINNLAQSLQNQENLRKRMAADVAHELRTPLANLQSSLEAMIDGIWEADAQRLQSCHEEILRINRLIGDLEKLELFEARNTVLLLSEFDVSQLVRSLLTNFETEFKNKAVALDFIGDSLVMTADRDKISQVIVNLLSNALKYTPSGGKTEVAVKSSGKLAVITVRDNGQGIPPEDLPYVFERFYRADSSRTRLTGGSGLGLSIVEAIVRAHGGHITVSSVLSKGTVFTVTLPIVQS